MDLEWEAVVTACLADWQVRGLIRGFRVGHDVGEGAYRVIMVTAGTPERHYSFTEAEFSQYVMGLADLAPQVAGARALALADRERHEQKSGIGQAHEVYWAEFLAYPGPDGVTAVLDPVARGEGTCACGPAVHPRKSITVHTQEALGPDRQLAFRARAWAADPLEAAARALAGARRMLAERLGT